MPAGSRLQLAGTIYGVELVATGYTYNTKKVLCFISTKGAAATINGDAYIQKWADEHDNLCHRPITRPSVCSEYFKYSPCVDNHHRARQHELGLEELWDTRNCWFRLHTTIFGMCVTDAWKLIRYRHVHDGHELKEAYIEAFSDQLAYMMLLHNNLANSSMPVRAKRPRVLGDVTNVERLAQHRVAKLTRAPKASSTSSTKQARCKWCQSNGLGDSWTTYYCQDCHLPLCVPNARHSRDCFNEHAACTSAQLLALRAKRPPSLSFGSD